MRRFSMPHPATMFCLFTLAVILLSWLTEAYGLQVVHPQTGELLNVQSVLSPEGIRWLLRHVISNFTGFAPLGMVVVALFGLGVAQHSGLVEACLRLSSPLRMAPRVLVLAVVLLGLLSNVLGDAGYILLPPIAASLFAGAGLPPVAGLITAYVSVGCGYQANLMPTPLDTMLSLTTREAAYLAGPESLPAGVMGNSLFMAASVVLLAAVIYRLTLHRFPLPKGEPGHRAGLAKGHPLSRKERRALRTSLLTGMGYLVLTVGSTYWMGGILRDINGGLARSPLMDGLLFLLSMGFGLMGAVYGFVSGRYRNDSDLIEGLSSPMPLLRDYFIIVFFAAQMVAIFGYSHLDLYLTVQGARWLTSWQLPPTGQLLLFILFTALSNLFMVSATAKWSFMAFIFIPLLGQMQLPAETVQCAYRIGDSTTNVLSPFMFYLPLMLTYLRRYEPRATYATLIGYCWRYSLWLLVAWSLLFVVWLMLRIPLGM